MSDIPHPSTAVLRMVMGAWISQSISTATRLDLPDKIKTHGPCTATQLVVRHGVDADPEFLERLLRACASVGLFSEDANGYFGFNRMSETLTKYAPGSIKKLVEIFGSTWWRAWNGLEDAVRTGHPQSKAQLGLDYWDFCKQNPSEMKNFAEAMKANSYNSIRSILEICDFSRIKTMVDIAGGYGHLSIALLNKYKELHGIVLDLPNLTPLAEQQASNEPEELRKRLNFLGGDMFQEVPPAEIYIMKHVIHNWDDEHCVKLLRNCHTNMQGQGRVISIDTILPPMGETGNTPAKMLDLNMLVFIRGKERKLEQWKSLYDLAGFKISQITPLNDNLGTSIIEGVKKS